MSKRHKHEVNSCLKLGCAEHDKACDRIAELEQALTHIDTWAKAYPLEAFPKPDLKRAAEVLKAAGMTLDAISADNMRHVLNGIKDIVGDALKNNKIKT